MNDGARADGTKTDAARVDGKKPEADKRPAAADENVKNPPATEAASPPKKPTRLPRYFSKLGLAEPQREEVLKLQATFDEREQKLKSDLADLQREREQALDELLTAEQRSSLEELRAARTALTAQKPAMESEK